MLGSALPRSPTKHCARCHLRQSSGVQDCLGAGASRYGCSYRAIGHKPGMTRIRGSPTRRVGHRPAERDSSRGTGMLECEKIRYQTLNRAGLALRAIRRRTAGRRTRLPVGIHWCSRCAGWHLTSKRVKLPRWARSARTPDSWLEPPRLLASLTGSSTPTAASTSFREPVRESPETPPR